MVTLARSGAQVGSCTTKVCSLAEQVKAHLGLPLEKSSSTVRMSNWSGEYLAGEQTPYAASDAYASFMLCHCLNAARVAMGPIPPPPLWAERCRWFRHVSGRGTMLRLEMEGSGEDVRAMTAADFSQGRHENVHIADRRGTPSEPASSVPSTAGVYRQPATPSWRRSRNIHCSSNNNNNSVTISTSTRQK